MLWRSLCGSTVCSPWHQSFGSACCLELQLVSNMSAVLLNDCDRHLFWRLSS